MIYAVCGLVYGLLIPYMARRFAKFMPATPGYALYRMMKPVKNVSITKKKKNPKYMDLRSTLRRRSLMWGVGTAVLSYAAAWRFGTENLLWYLYFIWSLLLLTEIDWKMFLLPDILTVPLLILGFGYAVLVGTWVGPGESAFGAIFGYFMPVLASMLLVWKNREVFGGGDIKLLAALGAWFGLEKLLYVIVVSTILFLAYALLKRQREGAYGPAIAVAAIIVAFYGL